MDSTLASLPGHRYGVRLEARVAIRDDPDWLVDLCIVLRLVSSLSMFIALSLYAFASKACID